MLGLLFLGAWLCTPALIAAYSVQEAILRVKPAVVLITTEVRGDVTLNCGRGPITVSPAPYIETGTGWFVDGRGYVVTNAHVVDPAYRQPPWVLRRLGRPPAGRRAPHTRLLLSPGDDHPVDRAAFPRSRGERTWRRRVPVSSQVIACG